MPIKILLGRIAGCFAFLCSTLQKLIIKPIYCSLQISQAELNSNECDLYQERKEKVKNGN
jgi:hypothetical protein